MYRMMVRPRGKAHGALGRCKRKFCGGRGPDAEDHGVLARCRGPWRLVLESEKDSSMRSKPTLGGGGGFGNPEKPFPGFPNRFGGGGGLSPSNDPRAQHKILSLL